MYVPNSDGPHNLEKRGLFGNSSPPSSLEENPLAAHQEQETSRHTGTKGARGLSWNPIWPSPKHTDPLSLPFPFFVQGVSIVTFAPRSSGRPASFCFFAFASWTTTDRARSSRPRRQPGAAWRRFWSPSAPRKTRFLRNPFVPEATLKSREPTVRVQIGLGLHLPVQLVFVLCGRRGRPRDLLILEAPWFS